MLSTFWDLTEPKELKAPFIYLQLLQPRKTFIIPETHMS